MPSWTKEQEEAIYETGSNIIVSAGAGSGKTAVLTERVIKKIEQGIHINELLILTFTKAAAGEMKERIRSSLKDNNMKEELNLIDQAYITTFDSYALSIVKKYHYLLNISNNISIVEDTLITMEKRRIMDEVFDKLYEDNDENFLKLINDFCTRDDQNLKDYFMTIVSKLAMLPDVDSYLDGYLNRFFDPKYLEERACEYEKLILDKIKELQSRVNILCHMLDSDYYDKVISNLGNLYQATSLDEVLLYQDIKLPSLPRGSEDEVKNYKESISKFIKEINELLSYGSKEKVISDILKTKENTITLINILKGYLKRIRTFKEDNEMYEFNDIAILAIKVLKDNPDICKEVRDSLKEILVDEYQDTNDLQETFINLIANNNVYMVGDIKQSIYRFRNANPYIFKEKYDNYSHEKGGRKIDLVKNFRSRDMVLNNINEIFDLVMDDLIGGAEYQESHRMVFGNTSYIEQGKTNQDYNLDILEYDPSTSIFSKAEIEIFAIAKDIKDKVNSKFQVFDKGKKVLKDVQYKDFVILMDRTSDFDLYKKIFEYLGIPLTLYKDETLNNSDDISIIKNIVTLIIKINTHTYDTLFKYAFMSVARSFLFRYKDNDILDCFVNNCFKDMDIYQIFSDIDINALTPKELIEIIITKTNYYEKMLEVGGITDGLVRIQKLQELASNLSSLGYDIFKFNDYLDTLVKDNYEIKYSTGSSDTNSVKIMTIHKSKGLEYHICYFSGLYKTFNISDIKDAFTFSPKYGIITPYFEEGINQTIYKELLKNNYMLEEISEKIRLFYVALTRAKEKMIMILPKSDIMDIGKEDNGAIENYVRLKYRSFANIMTSVKKYLERYYHDLDLATLGLTKDYLFTKEKDLDINSSDNHFIVEEIMDTSEEIKEASFSKHTHELVTNDIKKNMNFGTKVHEILEHIDFLNYKPTGDTFIDSKIETLLHHELMKNLNQAKIYKELEFMYDKDDTLYHGIIDLMIEYDDYVNIIDYKLKDVSSEEYIKQLKGYRDYISTKIDKPINLYLYSIIEGEIKEIN